GGSTGLRCHCEKRISVVAPSWSRKVIRARPLASKPRSTQAHCASLLVEVSRNQASPSFSPRSLALNSLSSCLRSVSTVKGLCASSVLCLRTVTCSSSGSYIQTRPPSATMVCLYGVVVSQRNSRGASRASVPELVLLPWPL